MDIVWRLLEGLLGDGLYDSLKDIFERHQIAGIIKELRSNATSKIMTRHQSEPYYNALDAYLSRNGIVPRLIQICYDKHTSEFQTKEDFAITQSNKFVDQNATYIGTKSIFIEIFRSLYGTIDMALNNFLRNQETRVISNEITASKEEINQHSEKLVSEQTAFLQSSFNEMADSIKNDIKLMLNDSAVNKGITGDELLNDAAYIKYSKKIKDIISDCQTVDSFQKAIDELNIVIQDIADSIDQLTEEKRHLLLLYLYDSQAQYYANMGELEKALQTIQRADAHRQASDRDEYKRHYYINAYILIQHQNEEKYKEALPLLDKAILLDNCYHSAVFLKYDIESFLLLKDLDDQVSNLGKYYREHIKPTGDTALIADYYQTLGIIYKQHHHFEKAIDSFQKSEDYQHDIANAANISVAYYSWATEKHSKEAFVHRPDIDFSKMITSLELMSGLLVEPQKLHANLRKMLIPFYISASHFCGQFDKGINLTKYIDYSDTDYQTIRSVILEKSASGQLEHRDIEMLSQEDRALLQMGDALEARDINLAIEILETSIQALPDSETNRLYQPLLGLHIKRDVDKYQSCKKAMKAKGLSDIYEDLHVALLAEMAGKIEDAKLLISECMNKPLDTRIVFEARDFYKRNNLKSDLAKFYAKIHLLIVNKNLLIDGLDSFYGFAIQFLIDEDYLLAKKIFYELSPDVVGDLAYHKIALMVHGKINNHIALAQSYAALYKLRNNVLDKIGQAQSYKAICDNDNAEITILEVLDSPSLSSEEKSMCFTLLSEVYLYKEEFDKSYDYAKQCAKLNEHIPSHQSHAILWARSMQCNRSNEGLATAIEYKHKHPVVVEWLKEVSLPIKDDGTSDPEAVLAALIEATGGPSNFYLLIDYYRKKRCSIYHLSELHHSTLHNVLSWHEFYNLKMRIFDGDINGLSEESANVSGIVVIDALTFLMLAKMKLLFLLNEFEQIFITSSSVERLQMEYMDGLSLGRNTYTSEAYNFLKKASNLFICPDSPTITKMAEDLHIPRYLYDSLVYAGENNVPFFYADEMMLYVIPHFIEKQLVTFSIPALLKVYGKKNLSQASSYKYNLLRSNYQFINFDCHDMYYRLSCNEFDLSKSDIEPFFRCKSEYHDMQSFGRVYSLLLECLINEGQQECAVAFTKYVFGFLDKTEKRSRYYISGTTDAFKYRIMQEFITYTLSLFARLLYNNGTIYSSLLEEYEFKFVSQSLIDRIIQKCK